MQSKNQAIIRTRYNIFENPEEIVKSNHSADRVRKKRLPSYFAGCVQSKNGVDLVEVSIFYKSEKTSGQTVRR